MSFASAVGEGLPGQGADGWLGSGQSAGKLNSGGDEA